MVSNTGQAATTSSDFIFAQPFTTGGNTGGYLLSSVGIALGNFSGTPTTSNYRVRIFSDSSGSPGINSVFATLGRPSSFTKNAVNVFPVLDTVTLARNTTYYVEASQTDGTGGLPEYSRTTSRSEDTGASSGWSIGDTRFSRRNNSEVDPWVSTSHSVARIRISGFAVNSAGDYTPPALRTSDPPVARVRPNGTELVIKFNEALDRTNLPPADAFTVTADGNPHTVTGRVVAGGTFKLMDLTFSPPIRPGQTVTVAYGGPHPRRRRQRDPGRGRQRRGGFLQGGGKQLDPGRRRAGPPDGSHGDRRRRHGGRAVLEPAGGQRRADDLRLPDRVAGGGRRDLAGRGGGHRQHGYDAQRHRAVGGDQPPLPGLGEKLRRHRQSPRTSRPPSTPRQPARRR